MRVFQNLVLVLFSLTICFHHSEASSRGVSKLKKRILRLAEKYEGMPDPDQKLQKRLEKLVDKLVEKAPMPPVEDRLPLLVGVWKQVWGPYDYRNDDGGIDPTLGLKEIYQAIFEEGYYYNIAPYYPNGDKTKEQIGYLRGEYELDSKDDNILRVRFTRYPGVEKRPSFPIWKLASLSEQGKVKDEISIVPTPVVAKSFTGGTLEEVYTDKKLRILYGTSFRPDARRFLYVMKRVAP